MKYIKRWMEKRIEESLEAHPVIILTGPRQVGKSTLLEHAQFLKGWKYLTLDDADVLEQAKEDPKRLLLDGAPTIIDEVQRCPELLVTIKYFVDSSDRQRKFILSGSGNVSLRQSPRETLAGRAKYLHLKGLSYREMYAPSVEGVLNKVWTNKDIKEENVRAEHDLAQSIWQGGLPGVVLATSERIAWDRGSSYIDTYINRDIQDLVKVRHPERFRRLMESLAQATGWESVQSELSKACSETRSNVSRYMSLLQDTGLLHELRGYTFKNERAYKQAKYYWFDSGAACFLSGIISPKKLNEKILQGRYFENFILQQISSWASTMVLEPSLYYWKPKQEMGEVDFVLYSSTKVIGAEVKSSSQIEFKDTKSMREFLKAHPEAEKGIIVYSGEDLYTIAPNIYAVPWYLL